MKKIYAVAFLCVLSMSFWLFLPPRSAEAQVSDTGDFLRALQEDTIDDVGLLLEAYTRPYAEGLGAVSNTGWVRTAGTHSVLGFDLSLSLGIAAVPGSKNEFDINDLGLTNIQASGPESVSPTISGRRGTAVGVDVFADVPDVGRQEITSFALPSGTDFAYAPAPMIQLSVGVPKNTDIMLRYVPEVSIGRYGDFSIFGLGIKHELNQWIPGYLPVDISFMAGYTDIDLTGSFTLSASDIDYDEDPNNLDRASVWEGQRANMNSRAWNANLLAGRTLGPLGAYIGLGIQSSSFELDFDGRYPFLELETRVEDGQAEAVRVLSSIEDPVQLEIDSGTIFRGVVGGRLRLGFVQFNLDFTYAEYVVLNAGVGFTFR